MALATTIEISAETNESREAFFRILFGAAQGYICIATSDQSGKSFEEAFFYYPNDLSQMLEYINKAFLGRNVYFCTQLLASKKRNKESVKTCTCAWADLDDCDPANLLVPPTIVVETSTGKHHGYWVTDKPQAPEDMEDVSRRIAYKHREQGCDVSGWPLSKLLRVPLTYNYKYGETHVVHVTELRHARYRPTDFEPYPQPEEFQFLDVPMPDAKDIDLDPDETLQRYRQVVNPRVWSLYGETPEKDWSGALWQLNMLLLEAGMSREEVFVVVKAAKCNKYERDGRADVFLWKDVCRAWSRVESRDKLVPVTVGVTKALLTDEERAQVEADPTFVERYVEWARSLGDAAWQYHQAGAFTLLSSLLAGTVRLPTSFGTIIPNLWFMILADTTLTRKSTAMDIAMDLLMEVDSDAILATDGSIEGLLTSLSMRPGRPSIFLRDEFSGLLEMMTKKDYYAGMTEILTKLYDGKFQKRVLRKETIEVRNPILVLFAGGIRTRICSLLTTEHVSSGFIPRFVFITAESDVTRLRPLGPPTEVNLGQRDKILDEIREIHAFYTQMQQVTIADKVAPINAARTWEASMTADAWVKYNKFEAELLAGGLDSVAADILTPTFDRLAKSGLKVAVLLAASRSREDKVVVQERDIVHAFYFVEQWRSHVVEVINNVGKTMDERRLDNIRKAIVRKPGIGRSQLMQNYHLTSREADLIFTTLEQRGLILRNKSGKSETFYTTEVKIGGK